MENGCVSEWAQNEYIELYSSIHMTHSVQLKLNVTIFERMLARTFWMHENAKNI